MLIDGIVPNENKEYTMVILGEALNNKMLERKKKELYAMLSYNEGDKETIYSIYPELFKGKKSFPFASDSAGNFICYDTVSKKYVFYNHETDTEEIIISLLGGLLF